MAKRIIPVILLMAAMLGAGYYWGWKSAGSSTPGSSTPSSSPPVSSTSGPATPSASSDVDAPRSTSPTFPNTAPISGFNNVRISAPLQDSQISSPVSIRGQIRVFEAQFKIVIQDGQNIIANQQVQASAGAPEWGNFDVKVPFETPKTDSGQIIFYTMSPKDGAPIVQAVWPVRFKQ